MTMFEYPFWKAWGMNGVAEWQTNWVILSKLTRASPDRTRGPRISWIITLHLWHGVAAGIVFGLLLPLLTLLPRWELLGSSGCCSLQYCTLDHLHFCTSEIVRVCRRYANFRSRPIARLGVPPRLWRLSWTLGASCLDGQALLPKLMRKELLQ